MTKFDDYRGRSRRNRPRFADMAVGRFVSDQEARNLFARDRDRREANHPER